MLKAILWPALTLHQKLLKSTKAFIVLTLVSVFWEFYETSHDSLNFFMDVLSYWFQEQSLSYSLESIFPYVWWPDDSMPPKKTIVHGPDDFPEDVAIVKFLPAGREILTAVTPKSGYSTEAVRTLSPSRRGCVFESEKKLTYFPVYTQTNCIAECRIDHTVYYCNCSHFYYHDIGKQPATLYYLHDLVHTNLAYVRFNRPNFETCLFQKYQNCVLKLYTQYRSKVLKGNFTGWWRMGPPTVGSRVYTAMGACGNYYIFL